jgi:hypothetical protein
MVKGLKRWSSRLLGVDAGAVDVSGRRDEREGPRCSWVLVVACSGYPDGRGVLGGRGGRGAPYAPDASS